MNEIMTQTQAQPLETSPPDSPKNREREIERLTQKEFLTVSETAFYINRSVRVLQCAIRNDCNFPAKIKRYGRVFFKRSQIDPWLDKRDKNIDSVKRFTFIVTKKSTGEKFIIENAAGHTQARRKARRIYGKNEFEISDYTAKIINHTKGEDTYA